MSTTVSEVTGAELQASLKDGVVLADFWASWCGPCRIQAPLLELAAARLGGRAKIVKVDVDTNAATAGTYGIQSIPTIILFKDGKPLKQFVGVQQPATLVGAVEQALSA